LSSTIHRPPFALRFPISLFPEPVEGVTSFMKLQINVAFKLSSI
jgi:hypothetical protein